MKTLTLPLQKKWFRLIQRGIKKEEYREIGFYWSIRFLGLIISKKFNLIHERFVTMQNIKDDLNNVLAIDKFDRLVFTLGYPQKDNKERRLEFKNPKIRIDEGLPEWGAEPGKLYFVITWDN